MPGQGFDEERSTHGSRSSARRREKARRSAGLGAGGLRKSLRQPLLVGQGEPHDLGFHQGLTGCFVSCRDHEIGQGAPLDLCRTLEEGVNALG